MNTIKRLQADVELHPLRVCRDGKPDDPRAAWRALSGDGRSWRRFPSGRPPLALLIVEALRGERVH